jgi:hypothetical protein
VGPCCSHTGKSILRQGRRQLMRILTFSRESYPLNQSTSYVLLHQSMALEELGHEVHIYNFDKNPLGLSDYVHAFDFELIFLDLEFLNSRSFLHDLSKIRQANPIRTVGALYSLPAPPNPALEVVDFIITPWKGKAASDLSARFDLRYLPLAYNARLHWRKSGTPSIGGIFVGNTTGKRKLEAGEYLSELKEADALLCVGPGFPNKCVDPFILGHVYTTSRCLPNFHYSWEKGADCMLNERFWQSARCGIPVNDYSPLMDEILEKSLVENFCFADKQTWQERVRVLSSGAEVVNPALIQKLERALNDHSYHHRIKKLLDWLQ